MGATNPEEQGEQEREPPTDDFPIGQSSQALSDEGVHSFLINLPTPQIAQGEQPPAFSKLNLLASQLEQSDFPPIEYEPDVQFTKPVASELGKVPAGANFQALRPMTSAYSPASLEQLIISPPLQACPTGHIS